MNPWYIIGWFVLIVFIAIPVGLWSIRLTIALASVVRASIRRRLAHAGRLRCQEDDCRAKAARRTPHGFYCEDHWRNHSQKSIRGALDSVSYAITLDYLKENS